MFWALIAMFLGSFLGLAFTSLHAVQGPRLGVPHCSHGEEVKAFIVRAPGAELTEADLIAWCRQNMAAYKYPRLVEFRDSLPMTATGKILKRELARQEQAEPAPAQSRS